MYVCMYIYIYISTTSINFHPNLKFTHEHSSEK